MTGAAVDRRDGALDRAPYPLAFLFILGACLLGFGLDFRHFLADRPPLLFHVHAAASVLWLLLLGVQILLVERGNVPAHRRLGPAASLLGAALVPLGLLAALVAEARHARLPGAQPQFLAVEFEETLSFSVLLTAGLLLRRRSRAHRRLMILAAAALSAAGFSRVWILDPAGPPPGLFGWWLHYYWGTDLLMIALCGWDLWTRGRVHAALAVGGAYLLASEAGAALLFANPAFARFAGALVGSFGWTG